MANLDELDYEDLIDLRRRVDQEISDREFILNAEHESNNLAIRWHKAQSRNLPDGEVPDWSPPTGAHDSYPLNWSVRHNNEIWYSTVAGNVWEPGVSGWRIVAPEGERPQWVQPTGAHDAYSQGDIVAHDDKVWISLINANVWEPPEQWEEVVDEDEIPEPDPDPEPPTDPEDPPVDPDPDPEPGYPVWMPWDNVGPLYQLGDRVTHNGKNWEATTGNNHWEPGVYGWEDLGPA